MAVNTSPVVGPTGATGAQGIQGITGNTGTTGAAGADGVTKAFRSGTVSLLITDLTKGVTFSSAMPSTNYTIHFESTISLAVVLGVGSKTVNGFNVLSTGVAVTVKYKAIED